MPQELNNQSPPTVAATVRAAVLPIVPVCAPDVYRGKQQEYCVYTMFRRPTLFGDDRPHAMRYLVSVHWFAPVQINPTEKVLAISRALASIGTYPTVENASDLTGQHYVFQFEAVDGNV